ncbi:tissue factor pathway inhibitor isoform 1-T1 [Dama dama]|uniref:tissue factor pathway inhibitor isoform X1 n=1 Tax=Dama dama TaxID=30532 RepID=UPI002A370C31|nr:tissue factor pathway inhibitor isoform X1 [Dama dama]
MINIMKKEQILGVSVCLLLSCASALLNDVPEEGEEYTNITDAELPPLKLVHSFCAMRADDGPCKAMIKRFFFNIHTQQCEEFIYGGCEGNQNRFETLEECKQKCTRDYLKDMTETKATLQKEKPDFCFLEEDAGICRGYITRYFYNNQSKQCERFKYGGCLGNLNNFESLEECKNTCEDTLNDFQVDDHRTQVDATNNASLTPQPSKEPSIFEYYGPSWCLTPADRGLCQANVTRFYYNSVIGKCRPFNYSGCGGNENNFISKKACLRACQRGFIQRISKEGLIKTKRKRKKQPLKTIKEEIIVKKICLL